MNETATDEQDLAKALDSVAAATNGLASSTPVVNNLGGASGSAAPSPDNSSSTSQLPPIIPADSPVTTPVLSDASKSEFPKITPIHDSSDMYYKPQPNKAPVDQATDKKPEQPLVVSPSVPETETKTEPDAATVKDNQYQATNVVEAKTKSPDDGGLASIKSDALSELRPLVDKLDVSPEEKFDTLLLMIRSTDDKSLVGPAHEAAKAISDESKRAEALLEVVKEIDYLSRTKSE